MTRFRPTVEVLDARTLPSATTAYMADGPAVSEIVVTKDLDCASTSFYMAGSPAVSEIVVTKDMDCASTS
jgi:hypothetical protein